MTANRTAPDMQLVSFAEASWKIFRSRTRGKKLRSILEEYCPEAIHEMPAPHWDQVNLPVAKQFFDDHRLDRRRKKQQLGREWIEGRLAAKGLPTPPKPRRRAKR